MDPLVIARYSDPVQMNDLLVEIGTAPARRWTSWPGGLVVATKTYTNLGLTYANIVETGDGSRISLTLTLPNTDNANTDLADDLAKQNVGITILKAHFDPATGAVVGTEPWFFGRIVHPRLINSQLELGCDIDEGRVGPSPRMQMKEATPGLLAPDTSQQWTFS